jgi:pilus assembly protein CpaB
VFPGDHVDLMLTQTVSGEGGDLKATETILRNLRILATDQSTETTKTEDGKTVVKEVRTVTLEVTPRIAEKIEVAQTIGSLSLALRSIADNQTDLDRAVASGQVVVPAGASKEQEEKLLRTAMVRPQDGTSTVTTGGDVSRFQRSSMPPRQGSAPAAPAGYAGAGGTAAPTPSGPMVRVTRGQTTTVEAAGLTGAARGMVTRQSTATRNAAGVVATGATAAVMVP